jgi:hypothetical protein
VVVEELMLLLALVELEAVAMLVPVPTVLLELSTQVAVEEVVTPLVLVEQVEKVLLY